MYSSRCGSCHQANGQGVAGAFPPLDGSRWVTGEEGQVIRIVLHGMTGRVEVNGQTYNSVMPGWGAQLSDIEIAAVITHERQSWSNEAAAVTPQAVAAVRALTQNRGGPWTAEELEQPDNRTVPSVAPVDTTTSPAE